MDPVALPLKKGTKVVTDKGTGFIVEQVKSIYHEDSPFLYLVQLDGRDGTSAFDVRDVWVTT